MATATNKSIDMKLEVVVVPVSDVDRAKAFYEKLGFRLDIDYAANPDRRVVQFTPPGSEAYLNARQNGKTSAEAAAAADRYMDET
jgi:catechol 2,3-dioxygenase-like lactoylglutathione lyase family enzyme